MNIDRVDAFLVDLPTTHPLQLSMTTMRGQTLLIAQLHNSIHISDCARVLLSGYQCGTTGEAARHH